VTRFVAVGQRRTNGLTLTTTALSASAVVDTTNYDRLALLPALTGNPGDQD